MAIPPSPPPAPWEDLFDELVELPEAERRERLRVLGERDSELAVRLHRMLAADASPASFLDRPATALLPAEDDEGMTGVRDQLQPGSLVGSWRVMSLLGRGGMGEVYLAERNEPSLMQRVALKIIKRGMDSEAIVRRFLRERQILATLDHPNLARLLDGGTAPDGRPYFALEWVDGEPITAYCNRHNVDIDGRIRLMRTVCQAVDSAHRRLVVHRDLKPANILVTPDGVPKLLDFGIAKLLEDDAERLTLTHAGVGALTPAYAAPEQILGEPVSTATDVYSLGVLLYELITGMQPHRRNQRSLSALASAIDRETIDPPSVALRRPGEDERRVRRVAGDLDLIVLTALRRDQARRYPSAQALADDLGRFLAGRPIDARPDDFRYRMRKFIGRNRVPVAALVIGGLALLVGLGASLWQAQEARLAAHHADAEAKRAERVTSFLVSIFGRSDPEASDPEAGQGARLTARELLEHGAAQIEARLAGEPAVQADLFDAVARIETNLSLLGPALAHARRALALRRSILPASDGRIGLSLETLGGAQRQHGMLNQARQSFEVALTILVPAFGEDSVEVATARRDLAGALPEPEQSGRAVDLERQALAAFVHRLGETDFESAVTLHGLGLVLEQDQQYGEAEAVYRRAVALLEPRLGSNHKRVLSIQSDLAGLLDRLGRPKEARPLFERAIAGLRAILGPRHTQLAEELFSYAVLLIKEQEYPAADAALSEALSIFGPDRFDAAHCLRYLGVSAMRRERYAEAAGFFTRAAETYRRTLGEDDVQRWRALANLGFTHFRLGRVQQARRELAAAVAKIERLAGAESYEIEQPLNMLGEVLAAAGAADEAVTTLRRVRALEEKLFKTVEHREVAGSDLLLARALLARSTGGDAAEARRLLDEGLGIFARVHPQDVLNAESLLESGRLALRESDRSRALRELSAAEPLLATLKGTAHADTREAHRLLNKAGGDLER
ncbi:MAG TPA: serine/threonine-protein kinase [Thermoanaerobaculia bacterium]|nr:serine/threonine-protein kinase [Thermoanaerobaculia bacterium]